MQDDKKIKLLGAADFVVGETYTPYKLHSKPFIILWKGDTHTLVKDVRYPDEPCLFKNTSIPKVYVKYAEEKKITKWVNVYGDGSFCGGYPTYEMAKKAWSYDKRNLVACIEVTASYHEGDGIND